MKNFGLLFLLICTNFCFAKKWDATYIGKLLAKGEVDKVIEFYEKRYNGTDRDPQDAFKIADLYVKKKDYESAIVWYEKEKQLMKSSKVNLLNYANTYRLNGEYQKALDGYLMYAAETGDASKVMENAYLCEKLVRATTLQNTFKLENYPFNSINDENNISVLRNNMIYNVFEKDNPNSSNNIKQSIRDFDKFDMPINLLNAKLPNYLITSLSYSRDGNKVVFSALTSNSKNKKQAKNESIFIADNLGGKFLNINEFPFNTDGYSYKNPTFNSEGNVIYFSSNQTGGVGGFDIWKSTLENDKWTKPQNLGKLLNSKFDECNPFLMQNKIDNILYFSSNREGGFGGFDIYKARTVENIWQDVQLEVAPINSAANDISIIYDNETKTGYFSSDRSGGKGGFDVYRFLPFNLRLSLSIVEDSTLNYIDFALAELYDGNIKLEEAISNDNGNVTFSVGKDKNYSIVVYKDGYKQTIVTTNTLNKLSGDSVLITVKMPIDKTFNQKTTTNSTSQQNFITFVGKIIDAATNKPAKVKMRMVNYTTNKLRELEVDKNGVFKIDLMTNNNYKIIIENASYKILDEITTFGLSAGQIKVKDYLLTGNKFKPLENRVYTKNTIPSSYLDMYLLKQNKTPNTIVTTTKVESNIKSSNTVNKPIVSKDTFSSLSVKQEVTSTAKLNTENTVKKPNLTYTNTSDSDKNVKVIKNTTENKVLTDKTKPTNVSLKNNNTSNDINIEIPKNKPTIETTTSKDTSKYENINWKQDFYTIDDPEIFYKIQIGNFQYDNINLKELEFLGKIEITQSGYNQYIYRLGNFNTLDGAKLSIEFLRLKGYNLAFILQYHKDKLINIFK